MKKILIINKSFDVGGIQTSLINLCSCIKNEYKIDLLIYHPQGKLKGRLPKEINIIEPSWMLEACGMSLKKCMKNGTIKQKLFRLFSTAWCKLVDNRLPIYIACKHQKKLNGYDIAIAYHHEAGKKSLTSGFIRVMNKCVEAKKKISWIHNDYKNNEIDEDYNDKYYKSVDTIVAVSKNVRDGFIEKHKELEDKVTYCYNFLDYNSIVDKCQEKMDIEFPKEKFICFSACRLHPIKGICRAIKAMSPVFHENKDIVWYIAGDGSDRVNIVREIKKNNLCDSIILLGNKENPYPYMNRADMVLLLSYSEAAPMVYSEVKFLGIPIFTTKIASTEEMLQDVENAIICNNNAEDIEKVFYKIIERKDKIKRIRINKFNYDEMQKNYKKLNEILLG